MVAGCSSPSDDAAAGDEEDLTSLTARQRILTFDGVVYVDPTTSEADVLAATRKQTQTAFGALLASKVAVRTRELQNVDPLSLRKREVLVVDTNLAGDPRTLLGEILYGMPYTETQEHELAYGCRCSSERVLASLASIGRADLEAASQYAGF